LRLVACQTCHAQYDTAQIAAERFTCRCGATLENRPAEARDAPVVRCGSCGGALAPEHEACSWCGSPARRRASPGGPVCPECFARTPEGSRFCTACGVAFRPEPLAAPGRELPCPACSVPMAAHAVAGIALFSCGGCEGLWVPDGHLERLLERAAEGDGPGEAAPAPRVRGANPSRQTVAYRRCPECETQMGRRNFQRSSGVIVDVCRAHGTWLDADELEQIAGFLRTRPADAALVAGGEPGARAAVPRSPEADALFSRILADHRALPGSRPAPERLSLLTILDALLR
jgi:Zn-finger nucleic acid-binding protein